MCLLVFIPILMRDSDKEMSYFVEPLVASCGHGRMEENNNYYYVTKSSRGGLRVVYSVMSRM
jgi:hypothetical protein